MRRSRQIRQGIVLCSAVALVGITIAISAGARDVSADFGSARGQVSGTGSIVIAGVTQTVDVLAVVDGVHPMTGSYSMSTSDGVTTLSSTGPVTCLFFSGSTVAVGVVVPGASNSPGVILISDGGLGGTLDAMEVHTEFGGDCTGIRTPVTLLASGNFTVGPPPVDVSPADGIDDNLQPSGTPAGSFVDLTLTPATSGSIVSYGGLSVHIADARNPDGVLVTVGLGAPSPSPAPSPYVELSYCGFTMFLAPGTVTTVTCGSVTLKVTGGTASVVLNGGTTVVSIPAGGAAKVTDTGGGSFIVANVGPVGSPSVSLTVAGTTTTIPVGGTTTARADFVGFSQPIDNMPTVNRGKAGQAVPVKWRLLDRAGAPITNLSSASITATTLVCTLGRTSDLIEEVVAGSSGLLNLGNGYYQLNWKSPTSYASSCKTLHLNLNDGVTHDTLFEFTK